MRENSLSPSSLPVRGPLPTGPGFWLLSVPDWGSVGVVEILGLVVVVVVVVVVGGGW
ncbi:MAG: hypothetical protein ACRDRH_12035 [Pseudonocardia sp.]